MKTRPKGGAPPGPPADCLGPAHWVRDALGFPADSLQARVLETGAKRGILNCTRAVGKSTVTAAKAVHQCELGDPVTAIFQRDLLDSAITHEVQPLHL